MRTLTLSRTEPKWTISSASLTHSIDANGDLSTLVFGFHIDGEPEELRQAGQIVPREGGDLFRPRESAPAGIDDGDVIGTFTNTHPDDRYVLLRSTGGAIIRMAQILGAHIPVFATTESYALPNRSRGIITAFTFGSIDLTLSD